MPLSAYTIGVPCKGYVKKYFSCIYGDPISLNHKTDFGDTILTKLITSPIIRVNKKELNIAFKDFNEKLSFQIPIDMLHRLDPVPSDQQVYGINRYLENVLETDLCVCVAVGSFFGVEKKILIERFCQKFDIRLEEDISYEAIKQREYRFRKSGTAKNLFLLHFDSPFAFFKRSA